MPRLPKNQRHSMVTAAAAEIPSGLHIIELTVENVKRVKVARIKPKTNVVVVAGKNGSGKSSVLDAIDYALTGVSNVPTFPIRKGQRSANIKVDLGDFIVQRHFTVIDHTKSAERNTYLSKLVITGKKGEQYPSPQVLLNQLIGSISFDPLAFLRMKDEQQLQALRGLVTFDVNIGELEAAYKNDYDERRIAGRGVETAKAQLAGLAAPAADLPSELIDTSSIVEQMARASEHNAAVERAKADRENLQKELEKTREQARLARAEVEVKLKFIDGLDGSVSHVQVTPHSGIAGQPKGAIQIFEKRIQEIFIDEPIDTDELAQQLNNANATNQAIQRAAKYRELQQNLKDSEELRDELDARMKQNQADRDAAMARAKMPIDGLAIDFDQVMYNGLPLAQSSTAEQIRVSMAIGMATNPKLRVLRIADGSLLDDKSLELIGNAAEEHNFQVWIERVETGGKVSVVMEDGEASGDDVVPAEEKKA